MFELTHTAELAHWKGDAQDPRLALVHRRTAPVHRARMQPFAAVRGTCRRRRQSAPAVAGSAIAMAAVALLLAGSALLAFHAPGGTGPAAAADAASAEPHRATSRSRCCPSWTCRPSRDQEYFADGLSEEILNVLAQLKELRVAGRTSIFSFKGRNEDLRVIGETLGVATLLEGSVRKSGDRLRITAQLINAQVRLSPVVQDLRTRARGYLRHPGRHREIGRRITAGFARRRRVREPAGLYAQRGSLRRSPCGPTGNFARHS